MRVCMYVCSDRSAASGGGLLGSWLAIDQPIGSIQSVGDGA